LFIRMKKTLFALFAIPLVLLPILLATCDIFELPLKANNGQSMARLSINVGGSKSRALTTDLAMEYVDYYEVVFKDKNGLCYQVEWDKEKDEMSEDDDGYEPWTITIPIGDYTGVDEGTNGAGAVMFAGHKDGDDYTLLAIGVISFVVDVDGTNTDSAIIKPTTKSVTFTLNALKNDVNDANGLGNSPTNGSDQSPSTFQILAPDEYKTDGNSSPYASIGTVGGYPVFTIPYIEYDENGTDFIKGRYKVTCGSNDSLFDGVKLIDDWKVESPIASYTIFTSDDGLTEVVGVPVTPTKNANTGLTNGVFVFNINLGNVDFDDPSTPDSLYCKIYIDVPVHALSATAKHADTNNIEPTIEWHIRGGIFNDDLDGGMDEDWDNLQKKGSSGGAVILKIVPLEP
jgi:hypothetical protein